MELAVKRNEWVYTLERQAYPWKLKSDELPADLLSSGTKPSFKTGGILRWVGIGLAGLVIIMVFLSWQNMLIQSDASIQLPERLSTKVLTLQISPSPNRYALWEQPSLPKAEETNEIKPSMSAKLSPSSEFPAALLNLPSSPPATIAVSLPPEISKQPELPSFNLIGIAQGTDGIVATVKIKDGNNEEIKDVRQGSPLLPGYTVTQIAEEYLLLKASKGGKTIRVD